MADSCRSSRPGWPPPFGRLSPPGLLDQNPPHRLGCSGEEMPTAVPVLSLFRIHEPEIGFMDQGRGLQRLAGILLRHLLRRQLPQFVVNERQQLFGSPRIPLLDVRQNPRDIAHDCDSQ